MAEETAARIASSQDNAASEARITDAHPFHNSNGMVWGARPDLAPVAGSGEYELGMSRLLYVRELVGNASVRATGPHLFQRMLLRDVPASERWTPQALSIVAGLPLESLVDQWALAHATDNLIDGTTATSRGLPQIHTWDVGDLTMSQRDARYQRTSRKVARTSNIRRTLGAAPTNYAAAYLFAESGAGISLSLADVTPTPVRLRLTRLR
jgi:hypothetical protein